MSNHYGQLITYGVLGAPALFTGDNMSFGYSDKALRTISTQLQPINP